MSVRQAQFLARAHARIDRARNEGAWLTALHLLDVVASAVIWLALLPVTLALHLAGFRRLTVLVGRIGHLAAEPDSFLKARALGWVKRGRYFIAAPRGSVANRVMLDYWRPHITIFEQPLACWLLCAMSRWVLMRHDMSRYVLRLGASQEIYRINAVWEGRGPLLSVSALDHEWSDQQFLKLGLPQGAWFVCVHVREAGFSPADESAHAYRNSDPTAVKAAMDEIVRRGGWCVRMGDPSMTPMSAMPGLIDYAHHPLRSERLDVLLCARARFFLGNTSGLMLVSSVFGVPSALANLTPLSVRAFLPGDIFIPKLLRYSADGRALSFLEAMGSPVGDFRYSRLYAEAGIDVVENTPEDIRLLVTEMLDRIEGRHVPERADEAMQRDYAALFHAGHYAYGAASRVGIAFLRKHAHLLSPAGK